MWIALDNRLNAIFNEIKQTECLADVGTDHGKIIVKALWQGVANKGIAIDISKSSLKKAKALAVECGVDDDIEFIVADGLKSLSVIPQTVVIAGMGGLEIIKILSEAKGKSKRYVLCAHSNVRALREYLDKNNYCISQDYYVKANSHFYVILVVDSEVTSKLCYNNTVFYEYGLATKNRMEYLEYLNYKKNNYKKHIIDNNIELLQKKIEDIDKLIGEFDDN